MFNPRVEDDVLQAAAWYESKRPGLGDALIDELIAVWRSLGENPLLGARKHPSRNLRWRFPERFPYRVLYEVDEVSRTVVVLAVLHAARHPATGA
ncbi:type II toxin-antitoxin system RelE/ParE family toxin [Lacunisphaera limnophila]|uniref:type II toxin-antitoxin system RelE/ParE family toxin n=1 Tax=Lacunisphaera limnophila TaxID=1838286 RepID=UPI0012FDB2D8|nr:type II toxin-antitoxin system RelE/ParE family toxin [Lacunisphaera limnophila]